VRRGALLAAAGAALLAGGCRDPYGAEPATQDGERPSRPPAATRLPEGELPGRVPAREQRRRVQQAQGRPAHSRRAAARAFAVDYTNWTGATVGRRFRTLARRAVGQARQDMQQAAASAGRDPQLADTSVANRGRVEGVVPQPDDWLLVVCREQTAPGQTDSAPPRYRVYRAHTTARAGGFVVDRWRVEP